MAAGVDAWPEPPLSAYTPRNAAAYRDAYAGYRQLFNWFSGPDGRPLVAR
jgi:hypothetical protein